MNNITKFDTFIAKSEVDLKGCMAVLERVRRKELNRVSGESVLDSSTFGSADVKYAIMACRDRDTQEIIGCMRLTPAAEVMNSEQSRAEYSLDTFPASLLPKLVISTRLAVLPEYRSSPAAMLLTGKAFIGHLMRGGQGMLGTCEPSLYPMYLKMGMRPIGRMHNSNTSGYRIPLLAFFDKEYFAQLNNPAFQLFPDFEESQFAEIKSWYYDLCAQGLVEQRVGIIPYEPKDGDEDIYKDLLAGISSAGAQRLLHNALLISCADGDLIIPENDGGKFMGFVYQGEVSIRKGEQQVALLKRGGLFGELALISGDQRSATVVSKGDKTKLLILSKSSLNMPNVEDELQLWKNMANSIAKKLLAMNN
jgi:hypothetical protein